MRVEKEQCIHMVRATSLLNCSRERKREGKKCKPHNSLIPPSSPKYLMWCGERERGRGPAPQGQDGGAEPGSVAPYYGREASGGTESV